MPELHYLDNQGQYGRMGAAFSDAVTGIMRLKLAQQQREEEQARNLAEFRLAQQRLGLEQQKFGLEKERDKREQSVYDAAREGSVAYGRLSNPGGVYSSGGPTIENARAFDPRRLDMQTLARTLAYVRGTNPSAAGRALEPQQFSPGPVYDWNAMLPGMSQPAATLQGTYGMQPIRLPGGPQPVMNVPPPEMTPFQMQQVDQRGMYNQILAQRLQLMEEQAAMRDAEMRRSLDIRQQVANQSANKNPLNALIQKGMQQRLGTNQVGRFTIRPKVTDNTDNTE